MTGGARGAACGVRRWSTRFAVVALLISQIPLSSCTYRAAGVRPLGEPVRVVVSVNQGRLVRVQGYLQDEVAAAIERKLGWQVSPSGSAKIELHIDEEIITTSGRDARGIASRWTISCRGQSLFTSRQGNANSTWTGTGYSGGLEDEAVALQQAAHNAAELITVWLENQAEHWPAAPE
jgi:hypothetical protein